MSPGSDHLDLDACVEQLRDLIRIPSVNPPELGAAHAAGRDPTGGETAAARYCAEALSAAGIEAEVLEAAPGRGSCFARLRASVPHPEPPLVLLSHVDVVPVDADAWSRDPFGGELIDGVVWGRGAVDMKQMVAMELAVMLAVKRSGMPLRRDLIFAALADEEAGGVYGALHWARERPDLFASEAGAAAAAINEVGGYSITLNGRRFYTLQVAEKGALWTSLRAHGTPGHGSMPHADNAAVKLAGAVTRLAAEARPARVSPIVAEFFETLGLGEVSRAAERDPQAAAAALERLVPDVVMRRSLDAMLRDTISPNVLRAGSKMNVIPGSAEAEVDVRTLPETDQNKLLAELAREVGPDVELEVMRMPPVSWPADAPIVQLMREAVTRADPRGIPVPMMITPGTDAKALMLLGIPTYGFAPLRLDPEVPFLSLFHGNDERVPVSALAFGLPVLHEVVSRFISAESASD